MWSTIRPIRLLAIKCLTLSIKGTVGKGCRALAKAVGGSGVTEWRSAGAHVSAVPARQCDLQPHGVVPLQADHLISLGISTALAGRLPSSTRCKGKLIGRLPDPGNRMLSTLKPFPSEVAAVQLGAIQGSMVTATRKGAAVAIVET